MPDMTFLSLSKGSMGKMLLLLQSLEQMQTKYMKLNTDIKFIKSSKKENLILTSAKVNVSIKSGSYKPNWMIAILVMNTKLQNKHIQKWKLKKEIKKICTELKHTICLIILNTLKKNVALKSKLKRITKRHETKLINFIDNKIKVPSELLKFRSKTPFTIVHRINCQMMINCTIVCFRSSYSIQV